jgi:hypothetical protein
MNAPPTHVIAPTGSYDVYTYDRKTGVATLHLACGDDHGRATLAMRKAPGTACIARGGVVTSLASGTPANIVAGFKAAVRAAHAGGAAEAAPAVDDVAASVKCSRPDCAEPSAGARGCAPSMVPFCRKHRTAAMGLRVQYKLTDEEAAARCVANGSENPPAKVSAAKPAASKKAPAKKPAAVVVNRPVSPEGSAVVVEAHASDFAAKVRSELDALGTMLIEKNRAYGNSALDPVRVFSRATPIEQLLVRIDDKLSRLARGSDAGEDVELDLVGYLVLLRIARRA